MSNEGVCLFSLLEHRGSSQGWAGSRGVWNPGPFLFCLFLLFLLCVYMERGFHAHSHFVKLQSSPFHLPERKKSEKEAATFEEPFLVSLSLSVLRWVFV